MKLITLVENTVGDERCIAEHGLCIYIETAKHKLLLDSGQTDAVVKNAQVLGVPLDEVDTVVLSHGHYDHSGGILPFSVINPTARIIMQASAAEPHFNGERYIGIAPDILKLNGTELVNGDIKLDDELFIFSGIKGRRCFPQGNLKLLKLCGSQNVCDDFAHEQCLVISQNGKKILLSGCAHNGILNIIDRYREIFGTAPDYAVTGFHLMKKSGEHTSEEIAVIRETAYELSKLDTVFFSGHCTGIPAFEIMKEIMGDKLHALHSGTKIDI